MDYTLDQPTRVKVSDIPYGEWFESLDGVYMRVTYVPSMGLNKEYILAVSTKGCTRLFLAEAKVAPLETDTIRFRYRK